MDGGGLARSIPREVLVLIKSGLMRLQWKMSESKACLRANTHRQAKVASHSTAMAKIFKSRERQSASPLRRILRLNFRGMEPPCPSIQPENPLKVGSHLIHPDFCKWLAGIVCFTCSIVNHGLFSTFLGISAVGVGLAVIVVYAVGAFPASQSERVIALISWFLIFRSPKTA